MFTLQKFLCKFCSVLLFEYLGGHCNLLVLKLSYIAVLMSLKLALKCAYTVKGPHNLALGYYFAELYDNALFVGFLPTKLSIRFFPEKGKSWVVVVLWMECFVSCLTNSFPILNTCFEASGRISVCLPPPPKCSSRFAEK